jgi:Ca2+:H+ antiporter
LAAFSFYSFFVKKCEIVKVQTGYSICMKLAWNLETVFYLMLLFIPLPIIGKAIGLPETFIFLTACLAIVPLAWLMGRATEYLADRVGVGVGGLLNATFGNACELIIAIAALRAGLIDVVKASITGSIIGNILLVLGGSMLAGGMRFQTQTFNRTAATTSATLLALAAISLCVPAVFHFSGGHGGARNDERLALVISIVQFLTYLASLYFSLKTHKHLYEFPSDAEEEAAADESLSKASESLFGDADDSAENRSDDQASELMASKSQAKEEKPWGVSKSITILMVATVAVAVLSEYLVHAVEGAASSFGMSRLFIGVVLVAIVGNAAEHSTAISMALKNKMDLSINIALGSGAQIALFVAPVIVFASFIMGKPMNLCFSEVEVLAVVVSVIILSFVATDGECNWLEGVQLLAVYAILAAAFYFA